MGSSESTSDFVTLHEIVQQARVNLNNNAWDYLIGATETETTMQRNRQALDSLAFRPRVLRDVSTIDCRGLLLGQQLRLPLVLAPIGSLETFAPGGGATATGAAAEFGVAHMLSSVCNPGLEEVAATAPSQRIFQLYVRGDDAWVDDHVVRAQEHGYFAFCITVDSAHYSRRERDLANRFVKSWRAQATGTNLQQSLSWDEIKRFKDRHDIPLILKGIATAEDAIIASDLGVEGIYVSNHGGRQLDHGRGSIDVLPEIVEAIGDRASVIIDGGFMRGSDIVKAMALGADAVGIGRLECLGLAAAGQAGVVRVLELLEEEVTLCLGLLGVTGWDELTASHLAAAPPTAIPHALSAFPLINHYGRFPLDHK